MAPWWSTTPTCTVAALLGEHRHGPLRLGMPLDEARALLGAPVDESWSGSPTHWLEWDDVALGFDAAADGRESLSVMMLEPQGAAWLLPAVLGATGWWPARGTRLEDFVGHRSLSALSLEILDSDGYSTVVASPTGARGAGALRHRRPLRERAFETVEEDGGVTVRAPVAAAALFSPTGFYRFLLPG
jgi:hypothetical protein